jgi:hypothetical protein
MFITHALVTVALTPARGSQQHSIRLRAGRPALASAA